MKFNFNFIKNKKFFYSGAIIITIISILATIFLPLNLGIDMTGGIQIEYSYTNDINLDGINQLIDKVKKDIKYQDKEFINTTTSYKILGEKKFIVEAGLNKIDDVDLNKLDVLKTQFKNELTKGLSSISSSKITLTKYVNIGESFGSYIRNTAYITLFLAIIFISLYIMWAFRGAIEGFSSYPFAFVTGISLFHDVIAALGFYVITSYFFPEFKVDTFFVTAMLTVLGYSISDTIVVMDRIRSNLGTKIARKIDFGTLVNNAINEVFTRSIYTSLTVLIVLITMFIFGPVSTKGFVLAMIYGTIFGTYSSIAIAAPLLYDISNKK
ncbi:hypothetical protein KAZ01_03895 [Candidatus Gracilibacteria bacterium]|nr:hypothetical protein [Candidatus Gracilibacteria bacterium]